MHFYFQKEHENWESEMAEESNYILKFLLIKVFIFYEKLILFSLDTHLKTKIFILVIG